MDVRVNATLKLGQPVSIQVEDVLFLGEIVRAASQDGTVLHQVHISETLTGLQSLLRLRSALLGAEETRASPSAKRIDYRRWITARRS